MAIYESNQRYGCECGGVLFRESDVFLLEHYTDKSKITKDTSLKQVNKNTVIQCVKCGKIVEAKVIKEVKELE